MMRLNPVRSLLREKRPSMNWAICCLYRVSSTKEFNELSEDRGLRLEIRESIVQ